MREGERGKNEEEIQIIGQIISHLFLSLFPQNTVLASLYSSEGSVMEVGISLIAIIILFYSF